MEISIRNATEADLPAIVDIYNQSIPGGWSTADTNPITKDISWRGACRVLKEELASVPRELRDVIILCSCQGRTGASAAKELQVSVRTVQERLRRGRELLEKRLIGRGLAPEVLGMVLASTNTQVPVAAELRGQVLRAAEALRERPVE